AIARRLTANRRTRGSGRRKLRQFGCFGRGEWTNMTNIILVATGTAWEWKFLGLLSIPILVALNGLFVAAEFALVAVRRTRVEELVRRGQNGAIVVRDAISNLDRSIPATQLGITLASIALGWTGEPALAHLLEPIFRFLPDAWGTVATHTLAS